VRVKTERYNVFVFVFVLEREVRDALARFERLEQTAPAEASAFVRE